MGISKGITLKLYMMLLTAFIAIAYNIPSVAIYYVDTQAIYEENLNRLRDLTINMSTDTLSFALAAGDREAMNGILTSIAKNPLVYSVSLKDDDGSPLAITENEMYADINGVQITKMIVEIESKRDDSPLMGAGDSDVVSMDLAAGHYNGVVNSPKKTIEGTLDLKLTRYEYDKALYSRILRSAIISFFIWVGLLIFLVWVSTKNVKFMDTLLTASAKLAGGDFSIRLNEDSNIKEFSDYARNYNALVEDLKVAADEREEVRQRNQEAQEFKQHFLQMAAHQIRTPIASIVGFLDLILQILPKDSDPMIARNLKLSAACADELEQQLVTIMNLSAVEEGSLRPIVNWFETNEILTSADRIFSMKAGHKGLTWYCDTNCFQHGDQIYTDKNILKEIVKIVTDNAIKYTDRGFIKVRSALSNDLLCIIVEDSGIGMSKSDINVVMDAPRQLDQGTTRTREGWGFGMLLLHKYVKLLSGHVNIESKKDYGSTFTITIPVQSRTIAPELVATTIEQILPIKSDEPDPNNLFRMCPSRENVQRRTQSPDSLKALVVEDNPAYSEIVKSYLESKYMNPYAVKVDKVASGRGGLILCRETTYDIIFVDYHMKEMNGAQFVRELAKQDNLCSSSKIIGMTADTSCAEHAYEELGSVADHVLIKPLDKVEIKEILKTMYIKAV